MYVKEGCIYVCTDSANKGRPQFYILDFMDE